ncbi:hypothetical protein K466DRAFT_372983 [Polyporus arcularius HHB13444]|uniref:Uncharacterized protein n=1 Tax=Polyporus arcularius HHB13444 TaxID=1314778 RepID=A0A5C3NUY1_9APHY|nr:hypothetical protein K466DRAFT_372983 [Polyporus arcularius HHB13444]
MYAAGTSASSSANSFSRHTSVLRTEMQRRELRTLQQAQPDPMSPRGWTIFPPSTAGVAVLYFAISMSAHTSKMVVIPRALSSSAVMHVGSPDRKTRLHACAGSGGVCGAEVADGGEAFDLDEERGGEGGIDEGWFERGKGHEVRRAGGVGHSG